MSSRAQWDCETNVVLLREKLGDLPQSIQNDTAFLKRNLRAREGIIEAAEKLLRDTLAWRESFGPHRLTPQDVKNELRTGKLFPYGRDKRGRSIIFCNVSMHNPKERDYDECIKMGIFCVEQAITNLPPGAEQFVGVVDCAGIKSSNADLALCQELFRYLDFYAERFGGSYVINTNWMFTLLYRMLKGFMPKATQEKIKVIDVSDLDQYISPENRLKEHGGTLDRNKIIEDMLHEKITPVATDARGNDNESESPEAVDEKKVLDKWFSELADHEEEAGTNNLHLSSAAFRQMSESQVNYTPQRVPKKKAKTKTKPSRNSKPTADDLTDKSEGYSKSTKSFKGLSEDEESVDKSKQKVRKKSFTAELPVERKLKLSDDEQEKKMRRRTIATEKSDISETLSTVSQEIAPLKLRKKTLDPNQTMSPRGRKKDKDKDKEGETSSTVASENLDQPLLEISPPSLSYILPLPNNSADTQLVLYNRHNKLCAYLVRTTSPKRYLAKPNAGLIPPGKSQVVTFSARLSEIPEIQDKFQIKAVLVNDESEAKDAKTFWTTVEKSRVTKQEIMCNVTISENKPTTKPSQEITLPVPINLSSPPPPFGTPSSSAANSGDAEREEELTAHRKTIFRYKEEIDALKSQQSASSKNNNLTLLILLFFIGLILGHLATHFFI